MAGFIGSFFTFQFSEYNSLTMHGEIQRLGAALLNAFRLACSLPRKKETKILYFVILISKCHRDYICVHVCAFGPRVLPRVYFTLLII